MTERDAASAGRDDGDQTTVESAATPETGLGRAGAPVDGIGELADVDPEHPEHPASPDTAATSTTPDTVPPHTIPTDTVPTDTVPTDTVPTDTVPTDTTSTDQADADAGARTVVRIDARATDDQDSAMPQNGMPENGAPENGVPENGVPENGVPENGQVPDGEGGVPVAVRPVRAPIAGLRQRMESTAALRRSLDAREAEALDLRASIERLRQELDQEQPDVASDHPADAEAMDDDPRPTVIAIEPETATEIEARPATGAATAMPMPRTPVSTPPPARDHEVAEPQVDEPPTGRRRTWLWVLVAALVAVLLLALVTRCDSSVGTSSTTGTAAGPAASGSEGAGAVPAAGASGDTGPAPQTTPMAWPSGPILVPPGMPTSGPGLDEPGTHVETAVDTDGTSMDVYESLVLSDARSEPLVLAIPTLTNNRRPTVQELQVELDGRPVVAEQSPDDSWTVQPPAAYTTAVLRYRLADAVVVQEPAKANRAGGVVLPLTAAVSQATDSAVRIRTADSQVLSMGCITAPLADQLCGAPENGVWTGTLPPTAERPLVYFLLDTAAS